jgi:hypothetical protein
LEAEVKGSLVERGDKNAKFFHWVENLPKINNTMDSSVVNRFMSSDSTEIREHMCNFTISCIQFDGISFNSIGVDEGPWMERAFEESDVLEVVRDLNSDKYPGP